MKRDVLVHRRSLITGGLAVATSLFLTPKAFAALDKNKRSLSFYNLHTGEKLRVTYAVDGLYVPGALAKINHLLRDHRTGDATHMDPQLIDILHLIQQETGSNEAFQIISGYRSPKTNNLLRQTSSKVAKKSLHMEGKAMDIRLPDRGTKQLRNAALSISKGGVGYYPSSRFVHIDTGRVRNWQA